ncbi:MAG TPA: hypothetical protein VFI29_05505 [Hanamia sp.]|nr:hypothetical protein [Hanamia sp.]
MNEEGFPQNITVKEGIMNISVLGQLWKVNIKIRIRIVLICLLVYYGLVYRQ